jgi:pyruvate dehydrogenase E2 component (dihydrolipoamide acetyltransferase)
MAERMDIKVPDIGEFTDVPVIELLVSPGDEVQADQSLVTLESDKATMEVPSPAAGRIVELRVALNDTVSEGDVVAVLEAAGEGEAAAAEPEEPPAEAPASEPEPDSETGSESKPEPESKPKPGPQPSADPATASQDAEALQDWHPPRSGPVQPPPLPMTADAVLPDRVPYASPAVRAFARELGVDLFKVKGGGRKGRIRREDVAGFVKQALAQGAPTPGMAGLEVAPPPQIDFSKFGETELQPLSRIKKISGKSLHRNWVTIPHVTHNDEADITVMESFRQRTKNAAKEQGFNLTPLAFIMKATVAALQAHPNFNASIDESGENLVLKHYYHLGIAVDTPDGLVVPAIRDCDRKSTLELARELGEVSQRARDGKLTPADWQGASFTISSLGGIGGSSFTPIINAPEVAILGVSRSSMKPMWDGEAFQPRLMLPLSLSYDHRVIDGAQAARFCRTLAGELENEEHLTL